MKYKSKMASSTIDSILLIRRIPTFQSWQKPMKWRGSILLRRRRHRICYPGILWAEKKKRKWMLKSIGAGHRWIWKLAVLDSCRHFLDATVRLVKIKRMLQDNHRNGTISRGLRIKLRSWRILISRQTQPQLARWKDLPMQLQFP